MSKSGNVRWKTEIPKKLYYKINKYVKTYGVPRSYFINYGADALSLKYKYNQDFPDPDILYRFSAEDEAKLVPWEVVLPDDEARGYDEFIKWYGVTGRDVLAAALYAFSGD